MTDPITKTLDELEALAKEATPGPWECLEQRGYASNFVYKSGGMRRQVCRTVAQSSADGKFIASLNPARALELIAVVRAAHRIQQIGIAIPRGGAGIQDLWVASETLGGALAKLGGTP